MPSRSPLDFLKLFAERLRGARIRFALTSGMACVHYGIQQNTKDTDWIVDPEGLARFLELLSQADATGDPWRVRYRSIFGAPLHADYLRRGWTSHLRLQERDGLIHKVDIFGAPPRVAQWEADADGVAVRHVVAQMKKTDRDQDWPMVDSLAWQMAEARDPEALLHLQDAAKLIALWKTTPATARESLARRRPLLRLLETESDPDRLFAWVLRERMIWTCVDEERYGCYQKAWKTFYRAWRREPDWQWPTDEPFGRQHARLLEAARRHGLPTDPIPDGEREQRLARALAAAAVRTDVVPDRIRRITPPLAEIWP